MQQKLFIDSLKNIDDGRANKLAKVKPKREKMRWRTLGNHVDCSVFMMRHMETFMGGNVSKRECGLAEEGKEQHTQLENLRYKYLAKMLLSEINEKKEWVTMKMNDFARLPAEKQNEIPEHAKKTKENRLNAYM